MRLAVLIDGENVSPKLAERIFARVFDLGEVRVRRVYGDFRGSAAGWCDTAAKHALVLELVVPTSMGKNATDVALTVGAMKLLRGEETQGFCIVSSDGDFASLAAEIRREGRKAFGFGEAKSTRRYREAFTEFHVLEQEPAVANPHPGPQPGPAPAQQALPAIRAAVEKCALRNGWYMLSDFGGVARNARLTPPAHGFTSFSKLLLATGQYVLDEGNQRFRPATPLHVVAAQ